jgi:uncharacterized protein
MGTGNDFPRGDPCWADLMTSDPDRSVAFYGELFGWKPEVAGEEFGGYITLVKDGLGVGGAMKNDPAQGMPDLWSIYLAVEDAAATCDAAAAAGGQVLMPAMEVGPLGSMAMVSDPTGAAIGMWQPAEHRGFGAVRQPGAADWFELFTRDLDAAVGFYESVFGWDAHVAADEPGFRYTTLGKDDEATAGIMDASAWLPEGVPAHWSVYFATTDADSSLAQAVELGASVVVGVEDTPYGKLATLADPTGAIFKLRQPPTG